MTSLRDAAQAALEALEGKRFTACGWRTECDAAITALKAALAEYDKDRVKVEEMKANWALQRKLAQETEERDKQQREYEEQRLAAMAEPTPLEDVVTHGSAWSKDGKRIDPMSVYAEPVQEPYAWMAVGGTIWRHKTSEDDVPLYTAPRIPLAEWQINDLMADIDPEDRDSWSFRQGVYAAEKHHGVRK